ncbi:MAG: c-type cytochrome [Mariprofundales bacterium]
MMHNSIHILCLKRLLFLWVLLASVPAHAAANGEAILKARCVACHSLDGPAASTLQQLRNRQGPDLFYAGNKYRAEWMQAWLQQPKRIRPAGMFYRDHIKPGAKHDVVDTTSLKLHLALSKGEAAAVTAALMKRIAHTDLVKQEKLEPASSPMGEMLFDKINGCMACHQIEPDFGGMSGSEVYTAGKRLQPAFMLSFIKNPQAWDPKVWMPNKHVPAENVQQLVNYLVALSKENFDE